MDPARDRSNQDEDERAEVRYARALLFLLTVVSVALIWILLPFYGTVLWGTIIALLFAPLNRRFKAMLGGRPTLAALGTLVVVLVIVVLPLAVIAASLTSQAAGIYQKVQTGQINPAAFFQTVFNALPPAITSLLDRFGVFDLPELQRRLAAAFSQGSQFFATQALSIGQNTFELLVSFFVTLYLAFFLIRDGHSLARTVRRAIPLERKHKSELLEKFTTVIRATVKGNLLVAAIQGALGGIAFWVLDIGGAMLWAAIMAFLSLLPAIGAAIVWLPVAIYLLATGALLKGFGLMAFGVVVIGLVDNLLRPILVGKDTQMPDYVVLVTTVGGMAVFGINGFVLGPMIAAMFIAVWDIHLSTQPPESS